MSVWITARGVAPQDIDTDRTDLIGKTAGVDNFVDVKAGGHDP